MQLVRIGTDLVKLEVLVHGLGVPGEERAEVVVLDVVEREAPAREDLVPVVESPKLVREWLAS